MACLVGNRTVIVPETGATMVPSVGSIAAPSPTMRLANAASEASLTGCAVPVTGETMLTVPVVASAAGVGATGGVGICASGRVLSCLLGGFGLFAAIEDIAQNERQDGSDHRADYHGDDDVHHVHHRVVADVEQDGGQATGAGSKAVRLGEACIQTAKPRRRSSRRTAGT